MGKMKLTKGQICNLHEAIKGRVPLPTYTLIETVKRAFDLTEWVPSSNQGFAIIEESLEEIGLEGVHSYCTQTQRWADLSKNEIVDSEGDDFKEFQNLYNEQKDQEIIDNIVEHLFISRNKALLDYKITPHHSLVDALLHAHIDPDHDGEGIIDYLKGTSFSENGLLKEDFSIFSETGIFEFLFAIECQINDSHIIKGSLTNVLSKEMEPEYKFDDGVYMNYNRLAEIAARLFLPFTQMVPDKDKIDDLTDDEISKWNDVTEQHWLVIRMALKVNFDILHNWCRLSFARESNFEEFMPKWEGLASLYLQGTLQGLPIPFEGLPSDVRQRINLVPPSPLFVTDLIIYNYLKGYINDFENVKHWLGMFAGGESLKSFSDFVVEQHGSETFEELFFKMVDIAIKSSDNETGIPDEKRAVKELTDMLEDIGLDNLLQQTTAAGSEVIRQQIAFNRDNIILRGDERVKALRKHSADAIDSFLKATVDYILASKLQPTDPERIELFFNSLHIFRDKDPIRWQSGLQALVAGQIDSNNEDGHPQRSPIMTYDDHPVERFTKIIQCLIDSEVSHVTGSLILDSMQDYLQLRICRYRRRCTNCDDAHLYISKERFNVNDNQIIDFDNAIDNLREHFVEIEENEGDDWAIQAGLASCQGLRELSQMIKVTILNQQIDSSNCNWIDFSPGKKFTYRRTGNIVAEKFDLLGEFKRRYSIANVIHSQYLITHAASMLIHLSESYISASDKLKIIDYFSYELQKPAVKNNSSVDNEIYDLINSVYQSCSENIVPEGFDENLTNICEKYLRELAEMDDNITPQKAITGLVIMKSFGIGGRGPFEGNRKQIPFSSLWKYPHERLEFLSGLIIDSLSGGEITELNSELVTFIDMMHREIDNSFEVAVNSLQDAIDMGYTLEWDFDTEEAINSLKMNRSKLAKIRNRLVHDGSNLSKAGGI
ncbi:MAG: hypothetical protein QGI21_06830 [Candidatus Poseidoniaceae archaeon]|nr:hypothetical protein [Candidatus Poseidoniaceae archaeon]